jgi:CheY-specific phosphatase CheX
MGFETHVLKELAKLFVVDAQGDTAYEFMKEQVACEVANTVLGNAIMNFPNKGAGVNITPPFMIGLGHRLFKKAHTNLCITEIKTSGGAIMLALLEENTVEEKLC